MCVIILQKNNKIEEIPAPSKVLANAILKDKEIEKTMQNTILSFLFGELAKQEYLRASSYEANGISLENEEKILKSLRKAAMLFSFANYYAKDQIEYYRKIQILNNSDPLLAIIYNTLEVTTKFGEVMTGAGKTFCKEVENYYKDIIFPDVENIAQEIFNEVTRDIIGRTMHNYTYNEMLEIDYYELVKGIFDKIDIKIKNAGISVAGKKTKLESKMDEYISIVEKDIDIMSQNEHVIYMNTKLSDIYALGVTK